VKTQLKEADNNNFPHQDSSVLQTATLNQPNLNSLTTQLCLESRRKFPSADFSPQNFHLIPEYFISMCCVLCAKPLSTFNLPPSHPHPRLTTVIVKTYFPSHYLKTFPHQSSEGKKNFFDSRGMNDFELHKNEEWAIVTHDYAIISIPWIARRT
jgi:hypothetical protein